MKKEIEYVKSCLPVSERLAQLAEEAAELTQAALKLRRAVDGNNPTPKTVDEALESFYEECADVAVCLSVLGYNQADDVQIEAMAAEKLARWAKRLGMEG